MNSIEFARNLFLLRREHRMTIEELASAMEVSEELVCQWECAKTSPTLEQMNRLAKVYGIPLADVIRSPKPADTIPAPAPIPEESAEANSAEANTTEANPAEIEDTAEVEALTEGEAAKKSSASKKTRVAPWEIFVIVLLLVIIAVAVTFLIKPEWFPLQSVLSAWSALRIVNLL